MEQKHTAGPWSIWNFNDDPRHIAVGPEAGGIAVADVVASNAHGCYTAETEAQGMVNARLIAAAPDMLEALHLYLMDCELEKLEHNSDTYEAARAAIAKAKGE